jgi:hypothetical protein
LTSIKLPAGVTTIGSGAFYNCYSLKSIEIPASVTTIGGSAFYNCTSLRSITFEGTVAEWKAISIETYWNYDVPATVVHCIDGNITI